MAKRALILVNLGTPASPKVGDVRRFLQQFLSDRRVVEIPRPIWLAILYLFILPIRSTRVSKNYAESLIENELPLRYFSQRLTAKVASMLAAEADVTLAMTYGQTSIGTAIDDAIERGCTDFTFIPMFPQYSATTTAAVHDQISRHMSGLRDIPQWSWVKQYCDENEYIEALATRVRTFWEEHGQAPKLLLSFHGIPQRNVDLGDPYKKQCEITAKLLADALQLDSDQWAISYQSRLGRAQWLTPYTDDWLAEAASNGDLDIDVICPAFAVDCIETLDEIAVESRDMFIEKGGKSLRLIPALNDLDDHAKMFVNLFKKS